MNAIVAGIISIIFGIIQYAIHYKNMSNFNFQNIAIVFSSSLGGLYIYENLHKANIPKFSEVFTEPPTF